MSAREETVKREIVGRVVEMAAARQGPDRGPAAAEFTRRFYANAAVEDLTAQTPDELCAAALALWQFAAQRLPGTPKVRVFCPTAGEHGWTSQHTVVQIVNDDMPFLVDSVVAELNRRELTVH